MKNIKFEDMQFQTPLYHAYCIEGKGEFSKRELLKNLENFLGFKSLSNPDFLLIKTENLGIDEGREIIDFQSKKSFSGDKKIIIIQTNNITREAQNSLLKTFEEPTLNTHFFLLMPNSEVLLPTLKSRLIIHKLKTEEKNTIGIKFLKESKKMRLNLVKKIIEEKNREEAIELLDQIAGGFYERKEVKKMNSGERLFIKTLNRLRWYLNDRSSSLKMILEQVALIAPQI
jgi:DNA polymerase III delta prime subunit